MRPILAIDPGPELSGIVIWHGAVRGSGVLANAGVLDVIAESRSALLAVEMISSYGMAVGREIFETCVWIGRFVQHHGGPHRLIERRDVKLHICGSARAKDANIRQALLDKVGPPGTKRAPGPTYGIKSHAWAALAVAITAAET